MIGRMIPATPQRALATDFELSDRANNRKEFERIIKKSNLTKILDLDPGVTLYSYPNHYILLDENKKRILYFMEYGEKNILGYPSYVQKKVWADKKDDYTYVEIIPGFSIVSYVLLHCLVKTKHIVTDTLQTKKGEGLWDSLVRKAFKMNLNVQLVNTRTRDIIPIKDFSEFGMILEKYDVYGIENKHQSRRIVISDYPLT
jgi:hypothetical protein